MSAGRVGCTSSGPNRTWAKRLLALFSCAPSHLVFKNAGELGNGAKCCCKPLIPLIKTVPIKMGKCAGNGMGNGPHTLKTACFDAKNPAHGHSHRRVPGRRPRDQVGRPIDYAAACQRRLGTRPARTRPARRRGGRGAGGGRRWPGGTRRCWWSGWVSAGTSSSCSGWAVWSGTRSASVPTLASESTSSPT